MQTKTFQYYGGGTETDLISRNGQRVEVIRELGDNERDIESGRMFEVRFPGGDTRHVFEEELVS